MMVDLLIEINWLLEVRTVGYVWPIKCCVTSKNNGVSIRKRGEFGRIAS